MELILPEKTIVFKSSPTIQHISIDYIPKLENNVDILVVYTSKCKYFKLSWIDATYYYLERHNNLLKLLSKKSKSLHILVYQNTSYFYVPYTYLSNQKIHLIPLPKQPLIESLKTPSFYTGDKKLKYYYYDFYHILQQNKKNPHYAKLVSTMYIIFKTDISYFNPKSIAYIVMTGSLGNDVDNDIDNDLNNRFWDFINHPPPQTDNTYLDIEYIYQREIQEKFPILKYFLNYRIDIPHQYLCWKPILKAIKKNCQSYHTNINEKNITCWKCKKKGLLVKILDKKYNFCRICYRPDLTDLERQDKWYKIEAHEKRLRFSGWTEQDIFDARY